MLHKGQILGVAGTLAIAIGTGYVMQNGSATAAKIEVAESPGEVFTPSLESGVPLPPSAVTARTFELPAEPSRPLQAYVLAAADDLVAATDSLTDVAHEPFLSDCPVAFSASAQTAAMVKLSLLAPCEAGQRITIAHAQLAFTEILDDTGALEIMVPALEKTAEFTARLESGALQRASAEVFTFDGFVRVAVLSNTGDGILLHAFEDGAGFDDPGHVWIEAPGTPALALSDKNGFLTVLGAPLGAGAQQVQVYSYPADWADRNFDIEVLVEAEVTPSNCGQKISGTSFEALPPDNRVSNTFSVFMPACDAVGDFIQLKSLLSDLTIAQN